MPEKKGGRFGQETKALEHFKLPRTPFIAPQPWQGDDEMNVKEHA